ncbi:MAG TPA: hypothetical protein VGD58_09320 [Herpetosiphonaceae bacterium]
MATTFTPPGSNNQYQLYTVVITDTSQQQSFYPFLLPPSYPSQTNRNITFTIADVYGVNASNPEKSCAITAGGSGNTVFSLAWDTTNKNTPIATISIAPTTLWDVGTAARTQLQTSYLAFLQQLESLETTGCLNRGGAAVVAQRVAESLPMLLSEMLLFYYGMQTAQGTNYVDLQPGMRLRVESAIYQFTGPGSTFNGFIGASTNYYDVQLSLAANGQEVISFDSFLGALTPPTIAAGSGGAGGIIDLQGKNMGRRHYRLFYPSQMPASNRSGADSILQNVTLIGADNLTDLAQATIDYVNQKGCSTGATGQPVLCTFFRGRTIVVPQIMIYLNGAPTYVPIGTTLRQLSTRIMRWPFNPLNASNININNAISMQRLGLDNANNSTLRYRPVGFISLPQGSVSQKPGLDIFDIPLVQGDRCNIVPAN